MFRPQFTIAPRVYSLLEEISEAKERIRSSLIKVPWVPSVVKDAMARMAWGSTAIEGCTLSLEAVRGLMEGKSADAYPPVHVRMAANYLKALSWAHQKENTMKLTERDLFSLHRIIAEGAVDEGPVGAYRKVDVRAGLHVGPPWKKVPGATRELLDWLNGPARDLTPVFSSALVHVRFVDIHPFRDGNGRVARLLATWELYRRGFDTLHVYALDEVLLENRALYIKNLERVQGTGEDLGGWLEFMAEALLETLERVEKRIRALGPLGQEPLSLSLRQEKLLRFLRERGLAGIKEIAQALGVTSPGAHYVLRPLLDKKVVVSLGIHKKTKYTIP